MSHNISKVKKVLLILPSYNSVYKGTLFQMGAYPPPLSLATIAATLVGRGHDVRIFDLNKHDKTELTGLLKSFSPDYAGISFSTPLTKEAYIIAAMAKKVKNNVIIISGGPHSSAMPSDVLKSSEIDVVCIGESDYSVLEVVTKGPNPSIEGIAYKNESGYPVLQKEKSHWIEDLDNLPFPAWNLFKINEYKTNRFTARTNPAGFIETSRGCPYGCIYCSKAIFGKNFRAKSVKRVVDEMEYMLSCGFRELLIVDDCFTFHIERAKNICAEILKRKLKFPWVPINGIRADKVDCELLALMKKSGCYRVIYGIESGDDAILKLVQKGETLEEIKNAVRMSRENGLEIVGYFMLALPGETKETMRKTINFAKELDLDFAKVSIAIPFPSTPYFEELSKNGKINITEWSNFNMHFPPKKLFEHPNLSWDVIETYYRSFYRGFYLRWGFILKRVIKNLFKR